MNINNMNDEELDRVETNLVDALMQAAAFRNKNENLREVVIRRNGKNLFKFSIMPIDEDVWRMCRSKNLKNKGRRNEELDNSRFLAQVIFESTIDEDKKRLWQNQDVWQKLNVASPVDVVNIVLTPAEKARITEVIESLSGYDDTDLDDMIKN